MNRPPAAHTPSEHAPERWHELERHLTAVAELAARFASKFGAERLGYYVGLWHDLGKYNPDFQEYLRRCHEAAGEGARAPAKSVPHAAFGARYASTACPPLMPVIYGHHAGLPEKTRAMNGLVEYAPESSFRTAVEEALAAHADLAPTGDRRTFFERPPANALELEFLLRMLFSALVDADFLDTEAHFEPELTASRHACGRRNVADLWPILKQKQEAFIDEVRRTPSLVNEVRAEVYLACLTAAESKPGVFRLSVPTGGGKTRSGLAFALRHAAENHEGHAGFDRVIVAVPYTSIIEQTAKVYRDIFGAADVLEHHSAVAADTRDDEGMSEARARARLLSQNWDAPIVVTTTVQLFESLFANRTSRCRKLHNIANSVIVLDEVQTLPLALLIPTLDALRELVAHYGVTLVLCTATQPAFEGDSPYLNGFESGTIHDIVAPEVAREHFRRLRRVSYHVETEPWSWQGLARRLAECDQSLTILNTRRDALAVLDALEAQGIGDAQVLHLSTLLCGAHRRDVLARVRERLERREPCLLVSTQVVEAGVDLDFPYVFRALGPLDRIVQAAGRCNREGKMRDGGRVTIFRPDEGKLPQGEYATAVSRAEAYLARSDLDLHEPDIFREYFADLYQVLQGQLDKYGVQGSREALDYPTTAESYRLIRDDTVAVVVDYGDVGEILRSIRYRGAVLSGDHRRLQPYVVSLRQHEFERHERDGMVEELLPESGMWVWRGRYDEVKGLSDVAWEISDLIQ